MNCCDTDFSAAGFPAAAGSINQRPSVDLPQPVAASISPSVPNLFPWSMKLFKIDVTGVTGASTSESTLGKPVKVRSPLSVTSHISHRH